MSAREIIKLNVNKTPEAVWENIICLEKHPILGFIFQMFSVEKLQSGSFSMNYEKIRLNNADYYQLNPTQVEILKLIESYEIDKLIAKFYKGNKKINQSDFFEKHLTPEIKTKDLIPYLSLKNKKILQLVKGKTIYFWGKGTLNKWIPLFVEDIPLKLTYHIQKGEEGLTYKISVEHQKNKVNIHNEENEVLVNQPAFVMINNSIFYFDDDQDAKKLLPFFTKTEINIPKSAEEKYLNTFILPIAEDYNLKAEGISINALKIEPKAVIKFMVFDNILNLALHFIYGDESYPYGTLKRGKANLAYSDERPVIDLLKRNFQFENEMVEKLSERGIINTQAALFKLPERVSLEDFIKIEVHALEELGFSIDQGNLKKPFMLKEPELIYGVSQNNDWFDVEIKVRFGLHEIPFKKLKNNILNNNRFYELPDGTMAILPIEWLNNLPPLFEFVGDNNNKFRLGKFHFQILESLKELGSGVTDFSMSNLAESLKTQGKINLPNTFKAKLRKYQTQGLNWLSVMNRNQLGCLLADDMGLGKTIQTLAFFEWFTQQNKPQNEALRIHDVLGESTQLKIEIKEIPTYPSFLVVTPSSLSHNWSEEIKKHTGLTHFIYSGNQRDKNFDHYFPKYEIIITTYGTLRNDLELFNSINFDIVVFDEAQNLKNPTSATSRACLALKAKQKVLLTGTPVENSLTDLWSLMNIANPGILGNYSRFSNTYTKKNATENATDFNALKTIIEPFILRRTKEEVAKELPPRNEQILYCDLTEEQKDLYEKTKAFYRNELLKTVKEKGVSGAKMNVLKGLLRLRQIANHPILADNDYEASSGKFNSIVETMKTVLESGHKILFFSQFVKHLKLFKNYLIEKEIPYAYIDGSISGEERAKQVKCFQNNTECRVFLSSLKAGGTGLNLTQADYVFLADPWWNPAVERQAMDRAHRIGRKNPVFVYKFITENTVEEKILKLQEKKNSLASEIILENTNWLTFINEKELEDLLS